MKRFALTAAAAISGCSLEPTPPCQDDMTAFLFAKEVIRGEMRSPSTADFPMLDGVDASAKRTTLPGGQCAFDIRTYVDAQNAFGGTVRASYALIVAPKQPEGWEIIRITRR